MKRICISLVAYLVSANALAMTQPIFSGDGSKASILINGGQNDGEALSLFNAMTAPEESISGKRVKRFQFPDGGPAHPLDLVCTMSNLVASVGTCALVFHAGPQTLIDSGAQRAEYRPLPGDLPRWQAQFQAQGFQSSDGRLQITAQGVLYSGR